MSTQEDAPKSMIRKTFPKKAILAKMSLRQLRLVDVGNAEEEAALQTFIDKRTQKEPLPVAVSVRDFPDIRDGETEQRFQSIKDKREEAARLGINPSAIRVPAK